MNTADFFACDYQSVNCISKEKQHCIPIRKATTVINEGEVPYGTKGRVRPDYYKDGFCVDIKNYNVESASGRSNLARNIEKQYYQRIENLPDGTKQSVMIDIRGQNVSDEALGALYDDIMQRTDNGVEILFKMDQEDSMAVGFKVKFYWYQIGHGDFLHSFFSMVAYNLENGNWGSRFPVIMNELYQGKLECDNTDKALEELSIIKKELQKFSPEKVVWDIEDLSKQPPWGNDISKDITDLSNYFVTSDGNDFLTVFSHALEKAKEVNAEIVIKSM